MLSAEADLLSAHAGLVFPSPQTQFVLSVWSRCLTPFQTATLMFHVRSTLSKILCFRLASKTVVTLAFVSPGALAVLYPGHVCGADTKKGNAKARVAGDHVVGRDRGVQAK